MARLPPHRQAWPVPTEPGSDGWRSWLPSGDRLPAAEWASRHRLLCWLLLLHVPAIAACALATGHSVGSGVAWALPPLALLGLARLVPSRRRPAGLAVALGLLAASALLVHLAQGRTDLRFHYVVAVTLVALYQDWAVFGLALAVVGGQDAVSAAAGSPLPWGPARVLFLLALCVALTLFWHANSSAGQREEAYRRRLLEGQDSVVAQLESAERLRRDLVATVSHEYRTPLTAIRGAAQLLRTRGDRLTDQQEKQILDGLLRHTDRLQRLVENMLVASGAIRPARCNSPCRLGDVVAAAVTAVADGRPVGGGATRVHSLVTDDLWVAADPAALDQALANLVDNAVVHARPGSEVLATASREEDGVVLVVANEPRRRLPEDTATLFDAFACGDSSATRETQGAGLGLFTARRLLEACGGTLRLDQEEGWVRAEARLPASCPGRQRDPEPQPVVVLPNG